MKTIKPSIKEIQDHYYYCGICTITLQNGQKITGNFTSGQIKEHGKIIGWNFIPFKEKPIIPIYHDQIAMIEKPD
jgi:hypothetical protein